MRLQDFKKRLVCVDPLLLAQASLNYFPALFGDHHHMGVDRLRQRLALNCGCQSVLRCATREQFLSLAPATGP